jgi:hypothetical protein
MKYFIILLFSTFLFFSCNNDDKAKPETEAKSGEEMPEGHPDVNSMNGMGGMGGMQAPATSIAYDNGRVYMADFSLEIPEKWNMVQPSSSMRIVEFLPNGDNDIPVAGFYFGNQGNMIDANIARWEREFANLESSETEEFHDGKIKFVILKGVFKLKPQPMAQEYEETPDFMTLACIIPSSEGPYFFKVFGPEDKLNGEIENFKKFLESYKLESDV